MNIIGLDFGTTNSILSFYNNKTNIVEAWKMGGSDGKNYIPSILTIDENNLIIGEEAKNQLKNGNKESYSKFKILLHEKDKIKLSNYNYSKRTPKDIAKLYIKTLIEAYKKEQCIDKIDSIVITVPEIWLNDDMQGRTIIKEITDELSLPLFKLISEPVAAGAYFLNNYKEQNKKSFDGHLLVFDYGGGTLDITLLESKNEHIKILKRSGQGNNKLEIGKAGALFDEKVVMHLYKKTFGEELQKNIAEFYELVLDFEQNKISSKNLIDKKIEQYNKNKL
jgi:molecular chaperone DnaK (HSP70)